MFGFFQVSALWPAMGSGQRLPTDACERRTPGFSLTRYRRLTGLNRLLHDLSVLFITAPAARPQ
jgi:hypothetical protein